MKLSQKRWLKQSVRFLLIAILAIALIPFAGFKAETAKAEGENSTFELTWTAADGGSSTIHWGTIKEDGSFEEFEAASLDTSVGSIDLRASYSGYVYVDAAYYTTEPSQVNIDAGAVIEGRTLINDVITKTGSADYYWQAEDAHNNAQPFAIADGSHIYAVYSEPDPAHPIGPTPQGEIPKPTTEKTVTTNTNPDGTPDGTYTIELDITGAVVTETQQTGANVIIIYDISQSMSQSVGNITRLEASRRATHTLIETLNPGTNDIDLALITFAQDSRVRQFDGSNWTKNGSDITNVIDGIRDVSSNLGTSWHEALEDANGLVPPDDDPTYVIFITDGCPSVNGLASNGHSHGAAGTSNTTDLCYTSAVAYAQILAGTKGQSYSSRVSSGNQSWTISGTGKGEYLYGIYTGTDTNNMLGQLITAAKGTGVITATSEDAIKTAFQNIAQTIVNNLGASGVTTTDGVTELSSLSADVHGAAGAFEYYRRGGKVKDLDGQEHEKYDHTANGGLGVTWADAPGAIYNDDGSVTWDLSSVGVAEAEVTYVLRFTVWPSQEAYDLIADLNNHAVSYDDLEQKVKDQVYEQNGKYYLKTNTTAQTSYTFQGNTYSDPVSFIQGQMVLDETKMKVKKDFAYDINAQYQYKSIMFYLLKDGKYYQKDGTTSPTLDESKVFELPVNADTTIPWTNEVYIAPGVMKDGQVLEHGHKYSLDEKVLDDNAHEYEYEFIPQTVRPMEINGKLTTLVLVDKYNPAPSGATKYYINDEEKTYRAATDSDTENVYYVATGENDNTLIGTNRKTAELDITKWIEDKTGERTDDQLNAETFTYRVTLKVPKDSDYSGITAYEYVPRYNDSPAQNRYTIFGYQEDEDDTVQGFSDDVERFSGKIYGAYTVVPTEKSGSERPKLSECFTDSGDFKTVTLDITLKRNEIIRFTNLPADTQYTITEMYNNYRKADPSGDKDALGSTMDANIAAQGYTTTIGTRSRNPVSGTVSEGSVEGTTVTGTIDYLDVRYYNRFINTLEDTIDVELTGTKHLEGYEWSNEKYTFNLVAGKATYADGSPDGTSPLPVIGEYGRTSFWLQEASGTTDKSYTFGKIRFTKPGTYTYTIQEDGAGTQKDVNGTLVQYGEPETVTIVIEEDENDKLSVASVTNESGHTAWDEDKLVANTTITNTAVYGSLEISKTVDPGNGAGVDSSKEFTFKVDLYTDNTKTTALDGSFAYIIYEGTTPVSEATSISSGGTLKLKHGQKAVFADQLPNGTYYEVTETAVDGYTAAFTNDKGTIKGGETATAACVNTYHAEPTRAKIPVIKNITPEDITVPDITGQFTFTLAARTATYADGTTGTSPLPTEGGTTVTCAAEGVEAKFGEITFEAIGEYTYSITESYTDEVIPYISLGTEDPVTVVVSVTDGKDGKLVAKINGGEPITFNNPYNNVAIDIVIPVEKILSVPVGLAGPEDITEIYTFTLEAGTATYADGTTGTSPLPTKTNELKNPGPKGGTTSFGVEATTGKITITKPGTYEYTIKERGTVPGVTNDPDWENGKKVTVTVEDDGSGTGKMTYTVNPASTTFTNTYSAEPVEKSITVKKVLIVPEGLTAPDITEEYDFTLTAGKATYADGSPDGTSPLPAAEGQTVSNPDSDGGSADFGTITFTKPGTYQYTVTEAGEVEGVVNDPTAEIGQTVTIEIGDNGSGGLAVKSITPNPVTFTNSYHELAVSIPVTKTLVKDPTNLEGPDITGQYTFTISGSTGAPMPETTSVTNEKDVNMAFGPITFKEPATYTYTVTETGELPGVTNDSPKTVELVVSRDPETGNLKATYTGAAKFEFVNTYRVKPTTASFPVKKVISQPDEATGPKEWSYDITVKANGSAPEGQTMTGTVSSNTTDTVTFGPFTFSKPGEYVYTVTESGTVPGVTNDPDWEKGKTVTISVTDNKDGTLIASTGLTDPLTFTNSYSYETTTATPKVNKQLINKDPRLTPPDIKNKFTFTLVAGTATYADGKTGTSPLPADGGQTVTNPASTGGTADFGTIAFDKPGTYEYTVTEDGKVEGVKNDPNNKTFKIIVSDTGDGRLNPVIDYGNDLGHVVFENTYEPEYGDLIIKKTLNTFSIMPDATKATFIFHITAEFNGQQFFKDYAALSFTEAGVDQVAIIGKLPVGAKVTVTEERTASYAIEANVEATSPETVEVTIAKTPVTAEFTNKYDNKIPGGYGIVNHYTKGTDGKWTGRKNGDNSKPPETETN